MKCIMIRAGMIFLSALAIGAVNAEVAEGNAVNVTMNGTACAAGLAGTEFASTTFNLHIPSVLFHSSLHHGDIITHSTTLDLRSAFSTLPAACNDIPLTLTLTEGSSVIGNGLTLQAFEITNSGFTTVGAIKTAGTHTLTARLVVDIQSPTDLATNLSYIIPVTISLVTR